MPRGANRDVASFDHVNVIEISTTTKYNRSWWGLSSEASRPPTSESEGTFDDMVGDSGEEEVDNDDNFPSHLPMSTN